MSLVREQFGGLDLKGCLGRLLKVMDLVEDLVESREPLINHFSLVWSIRIRLVVS